MQKKRRKKKYAAQIGGIFVALAVIGVIAVITVSMRLTGNVLDNSATKEQLENIVRPVIMFNPVPFETPKDIEPKQLILYSLWANLASEKRSTYLYDENGELRVPASDLDVAAAKLFGNDIKLEHQTFGDYTATYNYDAEQNVYNVPVSVDLYVYSPLVDSIERAGGDLYNVKVGYIAPVTAWTTDFSGEKRQPAPDKYMIFVMRKIKNGFQIVALKDIQAPAAENK